MMNLYREVEKEPKRTFKERIESVKLDIATSKLSRHNAIRKVTKLIHKLDPKDTATINEINDLINRLDLCDARYGKVIDYTDYQEFLKKIEKNGSLNEVHQQVAKQQTCYENFGFGEEKQ